MIGTSCQSPKENIELSEECLAQVKHVIQSTPTKRYCSIRDGSSVFRIYVSKFTTMTSRPLITAALRLRHNIRLIQEHFFSSHLLTPINSIAFFKCETFHVLIGTYTTPQGKSHTSAFLGLQKMETEKKLNNGEAAMFRSLHPSMQHLIRIQ